MRRTVKLGFRSRHGIENRNMGDNLSFISHKVRKNRKPPLVSYRMRLGSEELQLSGPIHPDLIPVKFKIPIPGPVTAIEIVCAVSEVKKILTEQLPLKSGSIDFRIGNVTAELKTDRTEPMVGEELNLWLHDLKRLLANLPAAPDKSDIDKEITE